MNNSSSSGMSPGSIRTQFKKGQSGNPSGKPKTSPEIKRLKELTQKNLKLMGDMIVLGNREDLATLLRDPTTNTLQVWIASIAMKGIQRGDMSSLQELLNRLIGKVIDKVEHTIPVPTVIRRSNGTEIELGAKLEKEGEEL